MSAVAGYFLQALAQALHLLIGVAQFLIVIRALLSWVSPDPFNPIVRAITMATEPFLRPFARLPLVWGGIDFTPIAALVALVFLDSLLPPLLLRWGAQLIYG
ncbi:MAG: YggT family protein [Zetaproteobacteria bacterium]|nr:MAG: YggT family protein [Zetaproteobacteria bacterium]